MKINSNNELYQFLKKNCPDTGSYAIVTYEDGNQETIWFSVFKNWTQDQDGNPEDWYLEAPNVLFKRKLTEPYGEGLFDYASGLYEEVNDELMEYLNTMVRDGYIYEIDSLQTAPFLPDKLNDITLVSESDCLDWMLAQEKNSIMEPNE